MRAIKVCIWFFLAASLCVAQSPTLPGTQPGSDEKVIHDPVEYNDYVTAINTPDPAQKAAALEAFAEKYPGSVVLEDALEQLLAAYQSAGKAPEVERTTNRILKLNENNVRALAILVALTRAAVTNSGKNEKLPDLRLLAERGLRLLPEWQNRDHMSEADFEKLKNQISVIFNGGAGFAALMRKEYGVARDFYTPAVALDPEDLQNTYQLSIADLEMTNPDIRGFWYVSRAAHICLKLQNVTAVRMITNYGLAKYRKYHGSEEGWNQILQRVATAKTPGPPPDFHVTRAQQASAVLDSNPSAGNAGGVSASILSLNRTPASIPSAALDPPGGPPASVLSSSTSGNAHSVPASVLSVNSPGAGHNVQASIAASATRSSGSPTGIAASILHAASTSAMAVSRSMTALSKALGSQSK